MADASAALPAATTDKPSVRVYIVTLRPEPFVPEPDRALRKALKLLLRRCGLRAVSVEQVAK